MSRSNVLNWILALIILLLLVPLLLLYNTQISPQKVQDISTNFDLLKEHQQLSLNLGHLVFNARGYVIYKDDRYLDKFNEYGLRVIKQELDLYNRAGSDRQKKELKELIDLTREYTSLMRQDNIDGLYREQYEPLAIDLQQIASRLLMERQADIKRNTLNAMALENSTGAAAAFLILLSLALVITGFLKIVFPMLVNHDRMAGLFDHIHDAVLVIDHRGVITKAGKASAKLLDIPASGVTGRLLNEVTVQYPPLQNITKPLFSVLLKGKALSNKQAVITGRGKRTFVNVDYYPLYYGEKLTGAAMVAHPVEMQKNKRHLFETIEAERKKISIEIHDWIGRSMSPIIHSLDFILRAHAEKIPADVHDDLVKLRNHCQTAAMDMRGIMNDIHPYLIDKVGLIPALESYVANFEQLHGINVYMFYQSRDLNIRKVAQIIIYRIIQEALSNVVKHSDASEVDIYFKSDTDALRVEIMDNGHAPGEVAAGKGLWGMKERANLIGGDLVFSNTESGFSLTLTVPLVLEGKQNGEN
ncbi:ATP-binding protein [Desulfoscipio geothermicus]|uniref:histidine kinase n=1 Tax=Desulfoscipio geothermicus DSM 3669 TaxID=1121426 RepID=A0A1I6E7P9_9FIRM|nr:ATP-binding protein [Desulfoscipio geothermicus]SFR13528.1 PAS fold [Desulfoscipio geothermicus DSM 3669]